MSAGRTTVRRPRKAVRRFILFSEAQTACWSRPSSECDTVYVYFALDMSLSCRAANVGCPFTSSTSQGLGVHWKSCKYRDLAISQALKKRKAHDDAVGVAQKRLRLKEQETEGPPVVSIHLIFMLNMPKSDTLVSVAPHHRHPVSVLCLHQKERIQTFDPDVRLDSRNAMWILSCQVIVGARCLLSWSIT